VFLKRKNKDKEKNKDSNKKKGKAVKKANISPVLNPGTKTKQSISDGHILLSRDCYTDLRAAERFRILKSQLEQLAIRSNFDNKRIFSITSALPSEGKSLVSINLSRALGNDPRGKILLVDCDLRKPNVHKFFGLEQGPGLSDVLLAGKPYKSLLNNVEPGLDVLTAGSPVVDSTRTIEQPNTKILLDEFQKEYNTIILDCPPALFCAEPVSLSRLSTCTILVARSWNTEKKLVKEAINLIGSDKIGGVVLNECEDVIHQYGYYSYYGVDKSQFSRNQEKKQGFLKRLLNKS